ncbi:hypothetical protein NE237_011206 [Protea cynaroides]|uniref:Phytocyanin domain-containing protein n=1 Tax=Protea cynaroides TaxID=273540 RepID=A0A9Q0JY20_9MAGN|nr:hypothetical protein NE237_011206 [Protea cynaroides]
MAKLHVSLFLLAAMGCALMAPSNAMDHIVGGSFGWATPPNTTFYEEWAKPRTFGVGDKLVFMYRPAMQNVLQVNEEEFKACTQRKPIAMYYAGPTVLQLNKTGTYNYYSSVGTHCESGQKLSVTVTNEEGSSGMKFQTEVPAPAPAPEASSAVKTIQNLGLVSGLLYLFVSMLV